MNNDQDSQNAIDTKIDEPIFRLLRKSDIQDVLKLMAKIKPNIGGARYPSLYNSLCHDALFDNNIVFTVAEDRSQVIGFYFSVIDRDRWRINFMVRHPFIGLRMIIDRSANRLRQLLNKKILDQKEYESYMQKLREFITPIPSNKSWTDSSPQIAKLLYIAVAEGHRGKNIAKRLTAYTLKVLAERGVLRVDGIVLLHNLPEIRLVYGLGFGIYLSGYAMFVTKDIEIH